MTDLPEKQAGAVRWYRSQLDGGTEHLYEPRRRIGKEVLWEPLCGLHGVAEGGRCVTCLELTVDAVSERSDA